MPLAERATDAITRRGWTPTAAGALICVTVSVILIAMQTFKVYKHTLFDGRAYIGITCQPLSRRWRDGEGYKTSPYFYRAIQKYGWDAFEHEVLLDNLTEEEAIAKEKELIAEYQTQNRAHGFNLTGGGEGLFNASSELRKRIGENSRRINTGREGSEKQKEVASKRMTGSRNPNYKGRLMTPERIEQIREIGKRPKSAETRRKMSKSAKKHRVMCVETGQVFESMKEAAEAMGVGYTTITSAIYDPQRRAAGYHWTTAPEFDFITGDVQTDFGYGE